MEISVKCGICNKALAKYTCRLCGQNCCESCYDKITGLCMICRQGRTVSEKKGLM